VIRHLAELCERIQRPHVAGGKSAVALFDGNTERAGLALAADGSPVLILEGAGKTPAAALLKTDGLNLLDENGNNRAVLGSIGLETVATGGTEETPLSSLTLFDKKGKVIWRAP